MRNVSPIECVLLPHGHGVLPATHGVLGMTLIGEGAASSNLDVPIQHLGAPLLGDNRKALYEAWLADAAGDTREASDIRYRQDGNLLYGVIELDEASFQVESATGCHALQGATEEAYRKIFRLIDAEGYPYLWRVWNYMGAINAEEQGLERYRQFNVGRQQAFVGCDRPAEGNVPAACALGVAAGPLSIAFLAARSPLVPLENPRQVSAYHYPADYGPRSPVFSRAGLGYLPDQEFFFISGTASIVGHQTVHLGDAEAQTRETFANIEALLAEAAKTSRSQPYCLTEFSYRAYVRHAEDFPKVAQVVKEYLGADACVVYVQADVCRADLLVEIEAMGSHSLERS